MVECVNEDTILAQHPNSSIGSVLLQIAMGVKDDRTIYESPTLADTTHCRYPTCCIRGCLECGDLGAPRHLLERNSHHIEPNEPRCFF